VDDNLSNIRKNPSNGDNMNATFSQLVEDLLAQWWEDSPVGASFSGVHEYDHLLGDQTWEHELKSMTRYEDFISRLDLMKPIEKNLDAEEQLDWTLLRNNLSAHVRVARGSKTTLRNAAGYPQVSLYGAFILLLRDFAPIEQRLKSAVSRMREAPRVLEEGMDNLRKGENIPRVWTEHAMEVTQSGMAFYDGLVPQFASQVPALAGEVAEAANEAKSAFEGYLGFLKDELLPRSDGDFALGRELYDVMLSEHHMVPFDADEVERLGKEQIERTLEELDKTADELASVEPWSKLVDRLKDDHPPADRIRYMYESEMARARDFVREHGLVTIPEGESLEVMDTPVFERGTIPYAAYLPPAPFEKEQLGHFMVTPVDPDAPEDAQHDQLRGHAKAGIAVIALHEAYPGHHLQLVHANRLKSKVRRLLGTSVFIEGWALYCEEMMAAEGFYGSLETRLLQLKDQLWRACRVVIDVGLHVRGMSFDDAVNMLVDVAKVERANAVTEVKRYATSPTQPMSYILGKHQIMELRRDYEAKEGEDFDLRAFHDELLSFGSVPVVLVRERMIGDARV
jgi:uncharacterized protein (DUF885 family)